MENNIITITIPEELRNKVQRADIERSARRDIIIYLIDFNKYFEFEQAKSIVEKEYVQPAANNKATNWNLDYSNCEVTIQLN